MTRVLAAAVSAGLLMGAVASPANARPANAGDGGGFHGGAGVFHGSGGFHGGQHFHEAFRGSGFHEGFRGERFHDICEHQIRMASPVIEVLILDTDAGEIPAILAISRTPLPDARNCLVFSTFGFAIGGLPNLIDRARAAA
jgi:hypothetical protein